MAPAWHCSGPEGHLHRSLTVTDEYFQEGSLSKELSPLLDSALGTTVLRILLVEPCNQLWTQVT